MSRTPALPRRQLLAAAALAPVALRAEVSQPGGGLAAAAPQVPARLLAETMAALARHERAIWTRDVIGIVDFGPPSSVPRFHLVDLLAGRTDTLFVAHGKGSDPEHTGLLQRFSDEDGSQATSCGAYLTGEAYSGEHGPSRRLLGLDPSDAHAEARAIVIHAAWYVGPEILATQGKLGRSNGCFAVSEADIARVLTRLGQGRLLYAGSSRPIG